MPTTVSAEGSGTAGSFKDMPAESHWSTEALKAAVSNELINGIEDKSGKYIKPNDFITRAQIATIVNRAFGATEMAPLSGNVDVPSGAWYYKEMQKAVKMGTMKLDSKLRPNDNITRQEAFTILGRALKMDSGTKADFAGFSDASQVADWAASAMGTMIKSGYIKGSNNMLNPKDNMTRAQFAVVMNNVIKEYIKTPGVFSKTVLGSMMVNVAGVTLENMTIAGDLIIGAGVGAGGVTLTNVIVQGNVIDRRTSGAGETPPSEALPEEDLVSAVTVTGTGYQTKIVTVSGKLQMVADIQPVTVKTKTVLWLVTNEDGSATDKATISANGLLTAVKDGKVKVRATSVSTPAISGELIIEIEGQLLPSTILFTDKGPITKKLADKAFINKVIGGDGEGVITYTSETPATATVNMTTGEVSIIAVGSTVITAKKAATVTHGEITSTYTVIVTTNATIPITKVIVVGTPEVGVVSTAELVPEDATATYQWKRLVAKPKFILEDIPGATSNTYIPVEDDIGWALVPEAVGTGDYSGSVVTNSAQVKATVLIPSTIIFANPGPIAKKTGDAAFTNNVTGGIGSGIIYYTSDNPAVAAVNKTTGLVTLIAAGSAEIVAIKEGTTTHRAVRNTYKINVAEGVVLNPDFAGGSGTISDPYLVSTARELDNVRKYLDKNFKQTAEINLGVAPWNSDKGWVGIGVFGYNNNFSGTYHGNGYKIIGLTINRIDRSSYNKRHGLFGYTSSEAKLMNITLENVKINGNEYVGSLVGVNYGTIENCHITGSVSGYHQVGGLAGSQEMGAKIYGCSTSVSVEAKYDSEVYVYATGRYVGGLVGQNDGMIENSHVSGSVKGCSHVGGITGYNETGRSIKYCHVTGSVTGAGQVEDEGAFIGGVVGYNLGGVENCYATGTVIGRRGVGGLVGYNDVFAGSPGFIKSSYATGLVANSDQKGELVGGLVGYNSGWIQQCYAEGDVMGEDFIGGLVGGNQDKIENCYASGSVLGKNALGGVVGKNYPKYYDGFAFSKELVATISNCYAVGKVNKADNKYEAGIVGYNDGVTSQCYYNKDTTGRGDTGKGNPKTTQEMVRAATFIGWDFSTIWKINEGQSYPYLRWQ